ncbi:5'-methylthioadenosine/S-adenosylhomocysteine nucleosidase family protein [Emticicia agri]|uniref:Nucleoside phosphorylase domain-containing protein n=1 Tax=Emticicia agri TaxID=2492393 RepID=A0A4Q5LSW1_9BACT|nr:hypothetical protein [Emticicia agri]RYU92595.1 hypothetical protein EWM59_26330 [Emticicia agri]
MQSKEYRFSDIEYIINDGLILMVTVTPLEASAFEEYFSPLESEEFIIETRKDNSTYYLGKFGKYNVAHVKCGDMGAVASKGSIITVINAINNIKPKFIIMIGIAFGINPKEQSVGDILVSKKIILYDSQKISKKIIHRGSIPEADNNLINCFDNIRDWKFLLPDGKNANIEICDILSGEKLINSIGFRKELQLQFPTAKGGEMEGAGLYAACHDKRIPWVLVKGICDFADGNKDKGKDEKQKLAMNSVLNVCIHLFNKDYIFENLGVKKKK